jgi:hypothetical protein
LVLESGVVLAIPGAFEIIVTVVVSRGIGVLDLAIE